MTNAQIFKAFRLLRKIPKLFITSFNMQGFPVSFDDRLSRATVRVNELVRPDHVQTTWFYPIPGTPLYDYCVERDLIDWKAYHSAEDYFLNSAIKFPIDKSKDDPIYYDK